VVIAYIRLAQIHRALRDPNKSVEVLREGIAINPKSPSLHKAIADSYVSIGDNEKAKEHLLIAKNLRQQQQ
jgi:Tfp pilus assembly protein PilF